MCLRQQIYLAIFDFRKYSSEYFCIPNAFRSESQALKNKESVALFQQALALHQAGSLDDAAAIYRQMLVADSRNADVLHMLGMLNMQRGNWQEGERLARQFLAIRPGQPEVLNNLGYALQNLGRNEESLAAYDNALQSNPQYAGAWYNRGNVLQNMSRHEDAVSSYRRALAIRPQHADGWINLGNACKLMQCHEEAIASYRRAISCNPAHGVAYNNLGNAYREIKRNDEALACYGKAIALNENYADAHFNQALVQQELGACEDALASYGRAICLKPDNAIAYFNRGNILRSMGRSEEALNDYDSAIGCKPDYADAYHNRGTLCMELGRVGEAEKNLEMAISLNPENPQSFMFLSRSRTFSSDDPEFRLMEALYEKRAILSRDEQINLSFAMGKALEDIGQYDQAFDVYAEGNRLRYLEHPVDDEAEDAALKRVISTFTRELIEQSERLGRELPLTTEDGRVPIFIVGMPRSGTTLVEQMLGSHPSVLGAGELPTLDEICRQINLPSPEVSDWKDSLRYLRQMGQEYIRRVWERAPNMKYVIDKMPGNFVHLGVLHLMLPGAKIIHVVRNPMDTCFSCYALHFQEEHDYAYDLGALGRYYSRYMNLMRHWHSVLPAGRILDLCYEDIIADQEHETRRLLDYLGLPWDDACLKFYESKRAVRTASLAQVRKPVYSSSVARWKRFEKHLGPLIEAIGSEAEAG